MPGKLGHLATLGVVMALAVLAIAGGSIVGAPLVLLLVLLGVYGIIGTVGLDRVETTRLPQRWLGVYFAVQLALVAAATFIQGAAIILLYPLFSQALLLLQGRRWLLPGMLMFVVALARIAWASEGWREAALTLASYGSGVVFVFGFTIAAKREQDQRVHIEQLAQQLRQANTSLSNYAAQVEQMATVQERNRIAREIHDTLGHSLTALSVQLEAARALVIGQPERAAPLLDRAHALAREGLSDVRRSVSALRAAEDPARPVSDAIRELVNDARADGLPVRFELHGDPGAPQPAQALALFRAAQEGLTNVRKHAPDASEVIVTLDCLPHEYAVRVADDGAQRPDGADAGFGLTGLRERVAMLGGTLTGAWNYGFALEVRIPR